MSEGKLYQKLITLIIAGILLMIIGEMFRLAALKTYDRRTELLGDQGIRFKLNTIGRSEEVIDPDLRKLIENEFFTKSVRSHPSLVKIVGELPSLQSNMRFKNSWDLLWYLEYIGDYEGLSAAIKELLTSGYFRQTRRCLRTEKCGVVNSASNLNQEDGRRLLELINRTFVSPAVTSVEALEFETAYKLAVETALLIKSIDFDSSLSPDPFDEVLAISTFLTTERLKKGLVEFDDIKSLQSAIAGEEISAAQISDKLIRNYISGLNELRAGCFTNSYSIFSKAIDQTETDGQRDLFIFLALRAVSRPFVDLRHSNINNDAIFVSDCGRNEESSIYIQNFDSLFSNSFNRIASIGLKTDIEFFGNHLPVSAARKSEIIRYLSKKKSASVDKSNQEEKSEALDAPIYDPDLPLLKKTELSPFSPPDDDRDIQKLTPSDIYEKPNIAMRSPVTGIITKNFIPIDHTGLTVTTTQNTSVLAALDGAVIYSGPFRSYDQMIIVRHEKGLHTVYANVGTPTVQNGSMVSKGDFLSTISKNTNFYFEIRNNNVPINPSAYFKSVDVGDHIIEIKNGSKSNEKVMADSGSKTVDLTTPLHEEKQIVVEVSSGNILHEQLADKKHAPASLAKIMTLYLLFEDIRDQKILVADELTMSIAASKRPPSKLGAPPGTEIRVQQAIDALVVKSANDVAAMVAEHLSGSIINFSKRMNETAKKLGMQNTVFKNASGLAEEGQYTTARDIATLGRRILLDFPNMSKMFNQRTFVYKEKSYLNHNRLVGKVKGVTGLKTGYTSQSGYNIAISANSGKRQIIAVHLGGKSSKDRNIQAIELVKNYLTN